MDRLPCQDGRVYSPSGKMVYFVSAHKEKSWISSGGLTQEVAWDEAARKAESLDWE